VLERIHPLLIRHRVPVHLVLVVQLVLVLAVVVVPVVHEAAVVVVTLVVVGGLCPVKLCVVPVQRILVPAVGALLLLQHQIVLVKQVIALHLILLHRHLLILGYQLVKPQQMLVVHLLSCRLGVGISVAAGHSRCLTHGIHHGLLTLLQIVLCHLLIQGIAVHIVLKFIPVLKLPRQVVQSGLKL
jgi:hypothetical protein